MLPAPFEVKVSFMQIAHEWLRPQMQHMAAESNFTLRKHHKRGITHHLRTNGSNDVQDLVFADDDRRSSWI